MEVVVLGMIKVYIGSGLNPTSPLGAFPMIRRMELRFLLKFSVPNSGDIPASTWSLLY